MRLPLDPRRRLAALRALVRARDTLARAPNLQRSAPEPTSWLLTRFQDCLNVGGRDAAADVLSRLKSELRLDALNLKFLEVQLLASFGDWTGIVDLPGFANLCLARRTPAITALLLEALYRVHLAIYSLTESSSRQAKAAIEEVAPTAVVECNADHGGTARLRALAENADLFVMTWLSAKHAATDFIRKYRGDRPLLYAQGRGFSSILRALEDHIRHF